MERTGIVVDANDPQKLGRVRVRIMGVHKPNTPKEELPWILVKNNGSNSGSGMSTHYHPGDYVTLSPTNSSETDWMVTGTSQMHRKKRTKEEKQQDGQEEMDYGADVVDETAPGEGVPAMSTGDIAKLAGTIFTLVNSNLFKFQKSASGSQPPSDQLVTEDLDYTIPPLQTDIGKEGGVLYQINQKINYGGQPVSTYQVKIELIGADSINGYAVDGTILHPELKGTDVYIPRLVDEGTYTIQYRATLKDDPSKTSTSNIVFKVEYI